MEKEKNDMEQGIVGGEVKGKKTLIKNKALKRLLVGMAIFLLIVIVIAIVISVKLFVIGQDAYFNNMYFDKVSLEGNKLILHGGFVNSNGACGKVNIDEKDGVVNINIKETFVSKLNKGDIVVEETFDNNIDTIYVGKYIIFHKGVAIDKKVSTIYNNKNPYLGDISRTVGLIEVTGIHELFEISGKNLQTTREPYRLTININENISTVDYEWMNSLLKKYSSVLIACIDNLGEVNWVYKLDGEKKNCLHTKEDVTSLVGEDIKKIAVEPSKLQETMDELGIIDLEEEKNILNKR